MFLKSPAAIIAEGEAVRLPRGRTRVDWECELGVVMGTTASYVPVARAADAIFGYTMQLDVSDREARGDGRYGSDWLIAKNHDTFAPLGPFITPKEFVQGSEEPARDLHAERPGDAGREHVTDDSRRLRAGVVRVQHHDAAPRRRHCQRHTRRRGLGAHAADLPEGRRRTSCTYEGVGTLTNTVAGP